MNLVPYPQSISSTNGSWFLPSPNTISISAAASQQRCITHALKRLGLRYSVESSLSDWVINIGDCQRKRPSLHKRPEAYALVVDKQGLSIEGYDKDGLYWALSTLEQLIDDQRQIPCVSIRDYPAFNLRYHHDDISRKQVSTIADFKRIIRLLSQFKIKYYTPYMEDMLFLPSHPDIGKGRGCLKPDEVAAMHKEAEKYNVTIFPTFSLIGHQENLLQNPKYRKYAREVFQKPSSFDPKKKIVRPLLKDLIKDVCSAFPDSPFFHACFDEIQGLTTDTIAKHANWCAKQIKKYDKRMMMWIDMFKNHDAIPAIHDLDPSIILVEFNYEKPGPEIDNYIQSNLQPAGLAGYNNWCCFVPDFRKGKQNIATWSKTMKKLGGAGFGCSMWGDNGYENSRDLSWNLFAYYGEVSWRGSAGPKDFEQRFQHQFYGAANKALSKLIENELPKRKIEAMALWRLFRLPLSALQRKVAQEQNFGRQAEAQLTLTEQWLKQLTQIKKVCKREAQHIDHFEVGLLRERLILKRIQYAKRLNKGLRNAQQTTQLKALQKDIKASRQRYRDIWLRHNKKPNIEVSLAVYDFILQDCKDRSPQASDTKQSIYTTIDLSAHMNSHMENVFGVPLEQYPIDQIPYHFAPIQKTHLAIEPNQSVRITFNQQHIRDVHLIYGGQTSHDPKPADCLCMDLYNGETLVYREQFKSISDICYWWAPRGDHIWAGGGLKYVNKKRTSFAYNCRNHHELLHLQNFPLPKKCQADRIVLSANGNETFALFALTLE